MKAKKTDLMVNPTAIVRDTTLPAVGSVQRFTIGLCPSANVYWRMWNNHMVLSGEARKYKKEIAEVGRTLGIVPSKRPIALSLWVYRARKAGDVSNRIKCAEDALCGVAFDDDAQVVEIHAYRRDDKENPRIEVEVKELWNE